MFVYVQVCTWTLLQVYVFVYMNMQCVLMIHVNGAKRVFVCVVYLMYMCVYVHCMCVIYYVYV